MITVKADRKSMTIRLPSTMRSMLSRGNDFVFWQSDDTIMLKQIQKKPWPAELPGKKSAMTLEEIDKIVHDVRKKNSRKIR